MIILILGIIGFKTLTGYAVSPSNNYNITCVYDKTLNEGPIISSTNIYQKASLNLFNSKTKKYSYYKPNSDICLNTKILKEVYCIKKNTPY